MLCDQPSLTLYFLLMALKGFMMKIGILGYGSVGKKLAQLFSDAGLNVTVGVRNPTDLSKSVSNFKAASFAQTAAEVEVLVLAIPYQAALEALKPLSLELEGKIVIDSTNPLNADWSPLLLGQANSASEEIQRALPQSFVIKAFNTIFADVMQKETHNRAGQNITAFVAGNNAAAKNKVLNLAKECGFAPLDTGDITSARYLEAMAHLNIRIAIGLQGGTNAAFLYHQV